MEDAAAGLGEAVDELRVGHHLADALGVEGVAGDGARADDAVGAKRGGSGA